MSLGLIGRKIGMTRIFTESGDSLPVTVVDVTGNRVTQVKTSETDGYSAVQVAFGVKRPIRVNKPLAGHFSKAGSEAASSLKEFRLASDREVMQLTLGSIVEIDIFQAGQKAGSIGMAQDPGRILPGKRMSGHLGNEKRTTQNLEIIRIDKERNLLLIKGAVPGSKGGEVIISSSVKSKAEN
jgi:large subunit ribosomal protein L3